MKNTEAAFRWIVGILKKKGIPFQVTGGFAAQLYGVNRELNDIDFDIPEERFAELAHEVKNHITFGPAQYHDEEWDIFLMTLSYEGQEIDFSALEAKTFDRRTQTWIPSNANLSTAHEVEVYGMRVPVVNRDELVAHKKAFGRDVDLIDVEQLEKLRNNAPRA